MYDDLFIHLRVHSAYSLLEGALPIPKLLSLTETDKQPAIGLADTGNLFGALEFSEKSAAKGIQPIIGCQLDVDFEDLERDLRKGPYAASPARCPLVLIALTQQGYANLARLVSKSYLEAPEGHTAHISIKDLTKETAKDLIILTGGPSGALGKALQDNDMARAQSRLDWLAQLADNRLYIELQRHQLPEEKQCEPGLIDLAYEKGVPLVATNDCFFPEREDFKAHDALICISEGRVLAEDNRRRLSPEHYFKSRQEMIDLFQDMPEAINSTVEIARRVSWRPVTCKPLLPRFVSASEQSGEEVDQVALEAAELKRQAEQGLKVRLERHGLAPGLKHEDYEKRLAYELSVIENMQFPGYFLIVADFIKWAKDHAIPVGPGRGSGAGSLVAWSLTITDLDPMRFSLLFERFLNPERVSMPDFDIDFCQDRRDEVIRYVQERYGSDKVAQIITFGTLQARAVLRDVGRVLQMPYGQVDRLCKLVPNNPANPTSLPQAIEEEPRLRQAAREEAVVGQLLDMGQKLEGLYRHASTHAAGIVIGDRPLEELVPLYRDPRSDMPVTQYNMKWVEQAGLVKFDFLGLKTLTVLQRAIDHLKKRDIHLDLSAIPLDDEKTYQLYSKAETVGVFQVESGGMRRALVDMKPDRFEDIIALVALYRPGPMDNIPTFNARKHGREKPEYLHEKLEPILKETFGIIVYQEQVMEIAQVLSGYSLGEADLLRRAMGKKIKAEMDKQKARFIEGAVENGLTTETADTIFELVAKFANYGFNKSHAAAYALVSYQTGYMKANYPVEFFAASMTLDMGNTDKLSEFRREAMRLGITVVPPSINRSFADFEVCDGTILYALSALKGVGEQAAEHIVDLRKNGGLFKDMNDVASRINPRIINKRCMESLIAAGVFDELEPDRALLFHNLDVILSVANRTQEESQSGQDGLFGNDESVESLRLHPCESWLTAEKLQREQNAIGFYLSAHPLDDYAALLEKLRIQMWADFSMAVKRGATAGRMAATVMAVSERKTRTGGRIGIINFSDPTGHFEAILFSEGLNQYRDILKPGESVAVIVAASYQDEEVRIRIQSVEPLEKAAERQSQSLQIFVDKGQALPSLAMRLRKGGESDVSVIVIDTELGQEIEVKLAGRYKITPAIAGALRAIPGVMQVQLGA
jgi:DNA polymerase-3 subunit alpha